MINWDDYERGRNNSQAGSVGSTNSRVRFGNGSPSAVSDHLNIPHSDHDNGEFEGTLRHRRRVLRFFRSVDFLKMKRSIIS